ncbi:MAG: helix-hairpin-helix domain-containing protein [Deltaproteobacteria bacterium]|nr:helix-hairpin-helix domain-containing protein [Deltaproteobacteria bacterium]
MAPARIALVLVLAAALLPSALRAQRRPEPPAPACEPQGRGTPPRHWIGCAADEGPGRALTGGERLLLDLPLDLNRAAAAELALVPGLSPRLAEEVVADRERRGPFREVGELDRVRGVGPARLARARLHLAVEAAPAVRVPADADGGR